MYDIKPLEEEWKRYRKKKRRPYLFLGLFIIAVAAGSGLFWSIKGKTDFFTTGIQNKSRHSDSVPSSTVRQPVYIENKPVGKLEIRTDSAEEEGEEISTEIVESLPLTEEKSHRKKPRVKLNIVTTEMPEARREKREEKPHKRVHLSITKTSGAQAYREVARRFKETQDPDDSLFLAKAYYRQKKYKKAEYWALQTNNINSGIEESFFIFVKAKVKLGHKNEAIRILSKYIRETNSAEAVNLLHKIKRGRV